MREQLLASRTDCSAAVAGNTLTSLPLRMRLTWSFALAILFGEFGVVAFAGDVGYVRADVRFAALAGQFDLFLPFAITVALFVGAVGEAMRAALALDVLVAAPVLSRDRPAAGVTLIVATPVQLVIDRNAFVENEAFRRWKLSCPRGWRRCAAPTKSAHTSAVSCPRIFQHSPEPALPADRLRRCPDR